MPRARIYFLTAAPEGASLWAAFGPPLTRPFDKIFAAPKPQMAFPIASPSARNELHFYRGKEDEILSTVEEIVFISCKPPYRRIRSFHSVFKIEYCECCVRHILPSCVQEGKWEKALTWAAPRLGSHCFPDPQANLGAMLQLHLPSSSLPAVQSHSLTIIPLVIMVV